MANAVILKELISELGLSIAKFERKIEVTATSITKAIERNSGIKDYTIDKITKAYPQVNRNWLETGKGGMFLPDVLATTSTRKEVIALGKHAPLRLKPDEYAEAFGDWKGIPMFNVPITASFIQTYRDETVFQPQYYLHDPRFKDCNFGVIITGDSMYPEIRHGDFVLCKEIEDKSFIVYGDIYYITAMNGLETCKYIHGHTTDEEKMMLVPRNDSIPSSPIHRKMIDRLFKVKGIVRGY